MIEVYAFLAAFTVQIAAMSVLYPAWFARYMRARVASFSADQLAQLYPNVDVRQAQERFLTRYRALNTVIAGIGLLFLGWFFNHLQRPDGNYGLVEALVCVYFALQMSPFAFVVWFGVRFNIVWFGLRFDKMHGRVDTKRKAVLQRRGLFNFVSPFVIFLAALAYLLFVVFVLYIQRHPFPGFSGPLENIVPVTLVYALNAFGVYRYVYGKKINPLETQADHLHMIGLFVKSFVYTCIVVVAFLSLHFTLKLLDMERWVPFVLSVNLVITTLLCSISLIAPPGRRDVDGLGASPAS